MQDTNQRLKNLSFHMEMMQAQIMDIRTNNQFLHEEEEDTSTKTEEFREIVEEEVDQTEEDTKLEGCGKTKISEEIESPHKVEFPQKLSYTEETETVDNKEVMMVAEKKERLLLILHHIYCCFIPKFSFIFLFHFLLSPSTHVSARRNFPRLSCSIC